MKKVGNVTQEKRSYVFKYAFEEQEFKLKEGKRATIANNLFHLAKSKYVNEDEIDNETNYNSIDFTLSKEKGPGSPFDPSKLELSTYNFIDSVLDQTGEFQSLRRLLQKENP